jgi:hypothetical protein
MTRSAPLRQVRSLPICLWASLWLAALFGSSLSLTAELQWEQHTSALSADIDHQPLQDVLRDLSRATQWEILVDPALDTQVTTRFTRLRATDALRRLLDPHNFALIPETDAPPTLYVYGSSMHDATLRFNNPKPASSPPPASEADAPPVVELIVRLKPDADTTIEELAETYGATVVGELADLDSYRLRFSDESTAQQARARLGADPNVAATESNALVPPPQNAQSVSASVPPPPRLQAKVVPSDQQIVVALLDTPVATDSPELSQLLLPSLSVGDAGAGSRPSGTLTHGTAMAETLYRSLASVSNDPDGTPVRILPVDIYGDNEATSTFDVLDGLLLAAANGADVINLSLGGADPSPLLQDAVQTLRAQGVLVVAAAGNQPTTAPVFPAAYPEVLAVTAVDGEGNIANYANRGEFIDLAGPGTSIVQHDNQAYLGTGTSYASAYITGQAAAYLSAPEASPDVVDLLLRERYGVRSKPGDAP